VDEGGSDYHSRVGRVLEIKIIVQCCCLLEV
jgi:hypothetical protein